MLNDVRQKLHNDCHLGTVFIIKCNFWSIIACNRLTSRLVQYDKCRLQSGETGRNAQRSVMAESKRGTSSAVDKNVTKLRHRVISCLVLVSQR